MKPLMSFLQICLMFAFLFELGLLEELIRCLSSFCLKMLPNIQALLYKEGNGFGRLYFFFRLTYSVV